MTFTDDAGDASNLTFTANDGSIVVTQTGGDQIAGSGPGCEIGPATTITCTNMGIYYLQVYLNNMDDQATLNGVLGANVYGGDGIDTLIGSDENTRGQNLRGDGGNDIIDTRNVGPGMRAFPLGDDANGGDGVDSITTGNGWDYVDGDECCGPDPEADGDTISTGPGNDTVRPGQGVDQLNLGEGNDLVLAYGYEGFGETLEGGPGNDTLQFSTYYTMPDQPAESFSVDLTAGTIAKTSEPPGSSTVPGFEKAITGLGADTVVGTDGPNEIDTTDGFESFFGDGGGGSFPDLADVVNPRAGADDVATGAGNDQIDSRDGYPDTITCGAGTDTVQADQLDVLDGCESTSVTRVRPAGADEDPPSCRLSRVRGGYSLTAFARGFTARVSCNEGGTVLFRLIARLKGAKGGKLIAKAGDLVLAEKSVTTASGTASAKLKPARRLLRRIRTSKGFKVRVEVDARDEFGNRRLLKKQVGVKKPKAKRKRRR